MYRNFENFKKNLGIDDCEFDMFLENYDYKSLDASMKAKRRHSSDFDFTNEFEPIANESLNTTFSIISENGEEIECDILFTYHDDDNDKNYIAYTDNSLDDEGNTKVFASIFNPDEENSILYPIETNEEWKMIKKALEAVINDLNFDE